MEKASQKTPLSLSLAAALFYLTLLLAGTVLRVAQAPSPVARPTTIAFGLIYLALIAGLCTRRHWALRAGGAVFLFFGVVKLAILALGEISLVRAMLAALDFYLAWYLLSSSTKRLLSESTAWFIDRRWIFYGFVAMVIIAASFLFSRLEVPKWLQYTLFLGVGVGWTVLTQSVRFRRLQALFSSRPADLSSETWPLFKSALKARARGDLDRAAKLASGLKVSKSVLLLRGLIQMERAIREGGLRRVVFDSDFTPGKRKTTPLGVDDAHALAKVRADLIDELLDLSRQAQLLFSTDIERSMELLSGEIFLVNAEQQYREWWRSARPLQSGEKTSSWLFARFWQSDCPAAAREVIRDSPHRRELDAALSLDEWLTAEDPSAGPAVGDQDKLEAMACLIPTLAEPAGFYLLDSRMARRQGLAVVAGQLAFRRQLVEFMRRLWGEYESCIDVQAARVLTALTGYRPRVLLPSSKKFDAWRAGEGARLEAYHDHLTAGLQWASVREWQAAEQAFARASEAMSERVAAVYNRALCQVELGRLKEAEAELRELTSREPREALWWVRLGDVHRLRENHRQALRAYEKAKEIAGPVDSLVPRLLSALLALGRNREVELLLDAHPRVRREPTSSDPVSPHEDSADDLSERVAAFVEYQESDSEDDPPPASSLVH